MKARVTEDCISCGLCVQICPEVFILADESDLPTDGIAQVKMPHIPEKFQAAARQAADECPVNAIIIEE